MASTRLNSWLREIAVHEIKRRVTTPAETEARIAAEAAARDRYVALTMAAYPPKDMELLAKYGAAQTVTKANLRRTGLDRGRDVQEQLDVSPVMMPTHLVPMTFHAVAEDPELRVLAARLWDARQAERDARNEKIGRYDAVVRNCRTVEELIDIFPYLEGVLLRKRAAPLSLLTASWIDEIRQDARQAAAAELTAQLDTD